MVERRHAQKKALERHLNRMKAFEVKKKEEQRKQPRIMVPHPFATRCFIEVYIREGETREQAIQRVLNNAKKSFEKKRLHRL